jgi:tetratricopeptide (TPR) repeat protein
MTSKPPSRPSKKLFWLLAAGAFLTAGGAIAGLAARYLTHRDTPPVPPEIVLEGNEPALLTALRRARERVLQEPHAARAWSDLGDIFMANEMSEEGAACYAQAERLDPSNPRWPYHQGGVLLNQGRREEAIEYFRRAVVRADARGERNDVPRLMLGETLLTLGRLDEAGKFFQQALQHRDDDPRVQFDLGLWCVARQDWMAAREHLSRCLGSPQARQRACKQLAVVLLRLGESAEADRYRREAESPPKDSGWPDPYVSEYLGWAVKKRSRFRRAEDLESFGRKKEALDEWRALAKEFEDDDAVLVSVGKLAGTLQHFDEAVQALRKARQLAPQKVGPHHYLSLALYAQGELLMLHTGDRAQAEALFHEAEGLARQVLVLKPDYGMAHMILGLCLKSLGRSTEAIVELRQAVRCNPENAELHFRLGEILVQATIADAAIWAWASPHETIIDYALAVLLVQSPLTPLLQGACPAEARVHLQEAVRGSSPEMRWRNVAQALLEQFAVAEGKTPK